VAQTIIDCGADYFLKLKGNQRKLSKHVKKLFKDGLGKYSDEFKYETLTSNTDIIAGRIETRNITIIRTNTDTIPQWLPTIKDWVNLNTVVKVDRKVEYISGKKPSFESHYYISSLTLNASMLLEIAVSHWSVETMHSKLDNTENYAEDKCRIFRGNSPEILSLFRKLGLNIVNPFNITEKNINNFKCAKHKESIRSILILSRERPSFFEAILTKNPKDIPPLDYWRRQGYSNFEAKNGNF
jgi:predicted transposase YbfD/YdcC